MDPSTSAVKGLQANVTRLGAELEQALVAVEDAQHEIVALARERDALAAANDRYLAAWRLGREYGGQPAFQPVGRIGDADPAAGR